MEGKAVPGQLVISRSGRDSGTIYLVIGFAGDRFLLVADGSLRRVEKPKRKNARHLGYYPAVAEEIAVKLHAGERVANAELRRAIQRLVDDWK
ncbi:MAG: KOW domain-containing RNA-binding protein [Firmicutes bacterium]|nr:KOW domain-containing RNA-binding protein [Bacillota bacterium]